MGISVTIESCLADTHEIKIVLQVFIGIIDADLLEIIVHAKVLEAKDVQHTDGVPGVQGLVLVEQRMVHL